MLEQLHYQESANELAIAVQRHLIILGVSLDDEAGLQALARESLDKDYRTRLRDEAAHGNHTALAKCELFGLAGLMLKTMENSADEGYKVHGNDAWKAFSRALWKVTQQG